MLCIDFPEANHTIGKPHDMTDEECHSVRAHVGKDETNTPFISTVWQPSYEDLKALNAGRPVVLKILGMGMPPVSLYTVDDEGNPNV